MPSLTKKIIRGKPYYYLRECQRVEGKPKIVSTIYLGPPQSILDRLGKTLLFTDRSDWTDEQIVLAYRAQHHVEADFRRLKDPHYLTFRPAFHWTDQKLKVHAFYCVLALLLNLLRRKLAQAGIPLSIAKMMDLLTDIREATLLYPGASASQKPFARTVLADMDPTQRELVKILGLERYRSP